MLLFEKLATDPSDWLVKWIDVFTLPLGRTLSPGVHVMLQRLDDQPSKWRGPITAEDIQAMVGTSAVNLPVLRCERILAAYLPMLRIGAIVRQGRLVGQLPMQPDAIELTSKMLAAEHPSLKDRPEERIGKLVHPNQYTLMGRWLTPYRPTLLKSRCLALRIGNVQYLIPRTLLFTTFYAFRGKLANAFCTGAWNFTAKSVISFQLYKSGIRTEAQALDNIWRIVLTIGMRLDDASLVAALWFDPHARACAEAIYMSSLAPQSVPAEPLLPLEDELPLEEESARDDATVNGVSWLPQRPHEEAGRTPGSPPTWFASALFPYPVAADRSLTMEVQGLRLAPSPLTPGLVSFLVTAITSLDWAYPEIVVDRDIHNSGSISPDQRVAEGEGLYMGGVSEQQTAEGHQDAVATSEQDPHADTPLNIYNCPGFSWGEEKPTETRQTKVSSQAFNAQLPRSNRPEAGDVVSGGLAGHEAGSPSRADFARYYRDPSERFVLLVAALNKLSAERAIDGWSVVAPIDLSFLVQRGNLDCWSLLSEQDRKEGRIPARQWEVIYSYDDAASAKRHPRSVLCIDVQLRGLHVTIFEIELRPGSTETQRMTAVASQAPLGEMAILYVLDAIRTAKRAPSEAALKELAGVCAALGICSIKHSFDTVTDGGVARSEVDAWALLRALEVVAGTVTEPESA